MAFQYIKGVYKKDGRRLFTKARRTRHNSFKLKEGKSRLDMKIIVVKCGW